ncbi:MAG TPA: hypothetical protein DCQ26_04710 [Marinilabiliales bacterium]|nr:MAG: hypothetical protein A2W95_13565 [Bacteroidetes bacterium GWA2_40_14]OFX61667.1 MAG: hypothetical protein A2W84_11655 [Bacteroidetes bacterium GWC2_40_13]OFX71753.1 MAG: hypothetical protein A2W96_03675 [Bacteroidetes bacterium GWD2_40_43]OFX90978.1 MAG: hypothetical protein A2W97_07585 [Bacteroidetes bacterium GWE2_40_63]HAM97891.1 hypothetical protein [Marinilabiliales bacterium]
MKFKLIIFFTFYCLLNSVNASIQDTITTDSLTIALSKMESPKDKVDLILDFISREENQFSENNNELAIRALDISTYIDYPKGRINAMIFLGKYYYRVSDYIKSMEYAQKSKEIAEDLDFKLELAKSYSLLGILYSEFGDYDNSSQCFFKSLKIYEKLKDKEGIAQSLGDIGIAFTDQQEYNKALDYYKKALDIANEINSPILVKRQYNNMAVAYAYMQNYDTAVYFLRKSMAISIKLGDILGQGTNLMNIGYDQLNSGKTEEALENLQKAYTFFIKLDNHTRLAECLLNIGYCYYIQNDTEKCIINLKNALSEGQIIGQYKVINAASKTLNQLYLNKKDTVNAFKYLIIVNASNDSIYSMQKQKVLTKLDLQYNYDKKEFQRKLAQQNKNTVMFIIIFSLVFGIIILGLVFSKHKLKSNFLKLEKEKIESELSLKNKELTINLIALIKKNELLSSISNKLIELEKKTKGSEAKDIVNQISHEFRGSTDDKMLEEFSIRFQEVHVGFYENLLSSYPDLTKNELNICAYLRLNMSTKEISELTGQQISSIDQARYRLRKKLNISNSETNLVSFLSKF